MINLFLKAKHWHLFLAIFATPFVFQMFFVGNVMRKAIVNENQQEIFSLFSWFPLIMLLYMIGFFGWVCSVGIGLQKHLPVGVTMKVGRFKLFLGIAISYLVLLSCWIGYIFGYMADDIVQYQEGVSEIAPDYSFLKWLGVIIPLHFFSMFAIFYSFYFNAKTLRSIELGREANSEEYLGHFFLFWFWFIGVWILQPTINKITDGTFEIPEQKVHDSNRNVQNEPDILD